MTDANKGFFNRLSEAAADNWKGGEAYKKSFGNEAFLGGGKVAMVGGCAVSLCMAAKGMDLIVHGPKMENGERDDNNLVRIGGGLAMMASGAALGLSSVAGSLRR